jgi:hypothetical protein
MTNVDKIEKLLEELSQEVKNAGGAIVAMAIVPNSDEESTIMGRSYGNAGRIAIAVLEAEKTNEALQQIRHCYKIIETENRINNQPKK